MNSFSKIATILFASTLLLSGCQSKTQETTSGFVDGKLDEKIETMFYAFEISNPYTTVSINSNNASEDKEYLVVELNIKNTSTEAYEISSAEFCVAWGDGDEDYIAPTTYYDSTLLDENQMPDSTTLNVNKEENWLLIYEVPSDKSEFILYCSDYYIDKDGNSGTGAEYDIQFTADQK